MVPTPSLPLSQVLFLNVQPIADVALWQQLIQQPINKGYMGSRSCGERVLRHFVTQLMWRHTKADVEHDLCLPPQAERVNTRIGIGIADAEAHNPPPHTQIVPLRLSAIEQAFYDRTLRNCCRDVEGVKQRWMDDGEEDSVVTLTHEELRQVLTPLLQLRQACCHPRVRPLAHTHTRTVSTPHLTGPTTTTTTRLVKPSAVALVVLEPHVLQQAGGPRGATRRHARSHQ